jgi:hypothetical protein
MLVFASVRKRVPAALVPLLVKSYFWVSAVALI